jgi:acetolactate synthase-1/2/3 large subunit
LVARATALPRGLLASAERPLLIAGSGIDRARANEALLRIVERLGCPDITSMAGRSVVPGDHPGAVYGLGAGGDLAKREADVVRIAGSRLGNLDLPYDRYWGDPATQRIVQTRTGVPPARAVREWAASAARSSFS